MEEDSAVENRLQDLHSAYKICSTCFGDGNFPQVHQKTEFEACTADSFLSSETLELAQKAKHDKVKAWGWTKEKTELLLDLIQEYGDEWETISSSINMPK